MEDPIYGTAESAKGWWIQGRGGKGRWEREREREREEARRGWDDCWNLHESITIVWPRNEHATTGEIIRNPCAGRAIELPFAISILLGPTDDNGPPPKANHLCDLSWADWSRCRLFRCSCCFLFYTLFFSCFCSIASGTLLHSDIPLYCDSLESRSLFPVRWIRQIGTNHLTLYVNKS